MTHCNQPMTAVEYRGTSQDYDGVSEYVCMKCGVRIGRWSGLELQPYEIERRYGGMPVIVDETREDRRG